MSSGTSSRSGEQLGIGAATPLLSVVIDPSLTYPRSIEGFSPSERFPEYRFEQIAEHPNGIYAAVRNVFRQAGLDAAHFGTPEWNPLGSYIRPGQRVFILCNFVYHRKLHESEEAFSSKCTHGSVLRALTDYALIATGSEGWVEFGNAPVQSADWARVLTQTGAADVADFYRRVGAPVAARDLRMFVARHTFAGGMVASEHRSSAGEVSEIDLGHDSLLAALDSKTVRYRVSDYDPARTERYHADGQHIYVVNKRVLDADVVISLPKLKTHEKVGITCGLKGFVGSIALKDCLAHHRMGPPNEGGDEFPSALWPLQAISRFHEWVQRRGEGAPAENVMRIVDRSLRRIAVRTGNILGGAWYGNDTAWRMALDIARILLHATPAGELTERVQRKHLMLLDGIVGGEGDGPLAPTPLQSGILVFSDDVALGDMAAAVLMGFVPERIPIVHEAFARRKYPVSTVAPASSIVTANGKEVGWNGLRKLDPRAFRPPRGWRGWVEAEP
jgi:uncharacterized protein (DUF362 family)